jgi:hypothetical protein
MEETRKATLEYTGGWTFSALSRCDKTGVEMECRRAAGLRIGG